MKPDELYDELRAAGLELETVDSWDVRGYSWHFGEPVGVMEHHTAPPVPFPVDGLYGDKLKANMNVKPDGTVWLIAYDACNYSSGSGSSVVLDEVLDGEVPTANASDRGLEDDTNGNPYFWNVETDHPGDGSSIPEVQLNAVAVATRVVLDHFGLPTSAVVSHAEWTARKSDPYWNGDRRCIDELRARIGEAMALSEADFDKIRDLIVDVLGGDRVTWEVPGQDDRRAGNNGVLNSALWPMYGGTPVVRTLEEIRDNVAAIVDKVGATRGATRDEGDTTP